MSLLSVPLKHFEIKEDLEITVQFCLKLLCHDTVNMRKICFNPKSEAVSVGKIQSNLAPLNQGQYSPIA